MNKLLWALILTSLVNGSAYAGWFGDGNPPKEFLELETCGAYSKYSCSLAEFSRNAFPSNFTRSWSKDGNGNWVLILKGTDVASGKNARITFTFEKIQNEKGLFANPVRINNDGQDIPDSYIQSLYIPMAERAGQSNGKMWKPIGNGKKSANQIEAEKQNKSNTDQIDAMQREAVERSQKEEAEQVVVENKRKNEIAAKNKKDESDISDGIVGHYVNRNGKAYGEINVSRKTTNIYLFSFTRSECKFEDKPVEVKYESYRGVSVGALKDGDCTLNLTFQHITLGGQNDDAVAIDTTIGNCNNLCRNPDMYLNGDYRKKH